MCKSNVILVNFVDSRSLLFWNVNKFYQATNCLETETLRKRGDLPQIQRNLEDAKLWRRLAASIEIS